MTLEERIAQDLKAAMKAKDQAALRSIRAVKSAILLFKTDGSGKELDEASGIKLLQKLVKQRKDSLDIYEKQGREDLAQKEREEISVIERYLPEQISPEKLEGIIRTIIEQTGANSMKDMGKVMGMASKQLAGKADGKTISGVVKQLLSQG
ncbi:MAG: GatB/YqeY domain-containing protein [Bacteroidota bacterium]